MSLQCICLIRDTNLLKQAALQVIGKLCMPQTFRNTMKLLVLALLRHTHFLKAKNQSVPATLTK